MKKYIQPETMTTELAMTAAILVGSGSAAEPINIYIYGGGDPVDGR